MAKDFIINYNHLTLDIISDCKLSIPFNPRKGGKAPPIFLDVKALWDTGATGCVITKKIAKKMSLKPVGKSEVRHAGGKSYENVYLISVLLPNGKGSPMVKVTECPDVEGRFDFIIGMNVIALGDFCIQNISGKSKFTFKM